MRAAALQLPTLRLPAVLREHWLSLVVLGLTVLLYAFAAASLAVRDGSRPAVPISDAAEPARLAGAPPAPEPLAFRPLPPSDAVAINAAVPISDSPNPAARPFGFGAAPEVDRMRALDCLTAAVYYEAAMESVDGQRAVAQVVLNRARHPAYPNTVCGVVYQGSNRATGCQFTFTCDGSLRRTPSASGWARARQVAQAALAGSVFAPVGWATHYHANYVVPYWSSSLLKAATIGTHIFYRWTGGWGRGPAFTSRHPGAEPAISRAAILAAQEQAAAAAAAAAVAEAAPETPLLPADGVLVPPLATPAEMANRPVVRRYEPLRRESAVEVMNQRGASGLSAEQRWALTGQGEARTALGTRPDAQARPLPPVLEGVRVRRRSDAPAADAPATPAGGDSASETR